VLDVDDELYEMKRAVAHLELALKAYHAAYRDQIDASRLLEPIDAELGRLAESVERARAKIQSVTAIPAPAQ
jgi:hypothetical protein